MKNIEFLQLLVILILLLLLLSNGSRSLDEISSSLSYTLISDQKSDMIQYYVVADKLHFDLINWKLLIDISRKEF